MSFGMSLAQPERTQISCSSIPVLRKIPFALRFPVSFNYFLLFCCSSPPQANMASSLGTTSKYVSAAFHYIACVCLQGFSTWGLQSETEGNNPPVPWTGRWATAAVCSHKHRGFIQTRSSIPPWPAAITSSAPPPTRLPWRWKQQCVNAKGRRLDHICTDSATTATLTEHTTIVPTSPCDACFPPTSVHFSDW